MEIKGIKKIINLGKDELSPYEFSGNFKEPYIALIEADIFIYSYENGGYDGSGMAVWRNNKGEWAYQYLGHCSCYGPLENIRTSDKAKFTLDQIKSILNSPDNSYSNDCKTISNFLNRYKK